MQFYHLDGPGAVGPWFNLSSLAFFVSWWAASWPPDLETANLCRVGDYTFYDSDKVLYSVKIASLGTLARKIYHRAVLGQHRATYGVREAL